MAIPGSEKLPPPSALDAAIVGVRRGRDLAAQLVALLRRSPGQDEAGGLAEEVLASFSRALSALDSSVTAELRRGTSASAGRMAPSEHEGRGGSAERKKVQAAGERRTTGQTRRSQPYGWRKVVAKRLEDGHTWRKYGQKEIHGAKYPRCYFRCTHKYDQGCQAARQVQKSEEDPSIFVITYLGHHTCNKSMVSLQPTDEEPLLISFGPPTPLGGGGLDQRPPSTFSRKKQESEDDALSSQQSLNSSSSSSSSSQEFHTLPELTPLEPSAPMTGISSAASDVAGDATLWFTGMDFSGESSQFEDMLGLERDDFDFVYC